MEQLKTLEDIRRINASFPYTDPIKEWKNQGKKVIGWSCIYVPEEIIYAAGILPVRVTGDSKQLQLDVANSYLYTSTCSFMRTCFELALSNQFDFLDGFVASTVCQGIIRLAEVWEHYLKVPVIYNVNVPRKNTERGQQFYSAELREFKHRLERLFDLEISEQDLIHAIEGYNETRVLLKKLYELKKGDAPPLSGAETIEILNAAVRMPKDEFIMLLKDLLEEISISNRSLSDRTRIMITGSILNNYEYAYALDSGWICILLI